MAKSNSKRKPLFGNNRSHALNATQKIQKINMQNVTINGKTEKMSTREAKKLRKNNA